MPNSDERREVAARLRDDNHGYGTEYDFFLHALGLSREGRGPCDWDKVHKRLADLIDPTCHIAYKGSFTASHDFTRWECGKCGAYAFAPKKVFAPRYCPHCGARVVERGED